MIRANKLFRLYEAHMRNGGTARGWKQHMKSQVLGITEGPNCEDIIDNDIKAVDDFVFSPQEVAMEFLGRDWRESIQPENMFHNQSVQEAEGSTVNASHFNQISAFNATISGLIDAMVLEAYNSPQFISDNFVTVRPTRTNGGKIIGVRNDEGTAMDQDLLDGESYPAGGLKQTYVTKQENKRWGRAMSISEDTFLYDRTDTIESMAKEGTGYPVRRRKEIMIADAVLGITNPHSQDGKSGNTYLTSASDKPRDYVNSETNALLDWNDIDQVIQLLGAMTDPHSGYEIDVSDNPMMLVSPHKQMNASTILTAIQVRVATNTAADLRLANSPIPSNIKMFSSWIWYNRLILAAASGGEGASATNAKGRWYFGNFPKAFQYDQLVPFETRVLPLTGDEIRKDIVWHGLAREKGVVQVKNPRYVAKETVE